MAKRKRFKPGLRTLCAIGTVAHNRTFTASELRQFAAVASGPGRTSDVTSTIRWLRKHKLVVPAGTRQYYPTEKGWNMIEKACSFKRSRR